MTALATFASPAQSRVDTGATRILLDSVIAADLGIEIQAVSPASLPDFQILDSSLELVARGDDLEGFAAGFVMHGGGVVLSHGGRSLGLAGLRLVPGALPLELDVVDAEGTVWLTVGSMHARLSGTNLTIRNADLLMSPALAGWLGQPLLADTYLGDFEADWIVDASGPQAAILLGGQCSPNPSLPIDVALIGLNSLTQAAREIGGRVAMAPSAVLKNVGQGSVAWNNAIAPDIPTGEHPFLALQLYRLSNGVLEQIGFSDLKHAFFAVNSNCPCPGANILYPDCEDTYGVTTNLNRFHLAPREEVDITGVDWVSLGSHFDGAPVDDVRDHQGNLDHDDFEHRLIAMESELSTAGAAYYIEAWYVVKNDIDLLNSLGHRRVSPILIGGTWSFPFSSALANASIVDVFVDPVSHGPGEASVLADTGEGRLQLAVQATPIGGGEIHYEYVLMNFDFERQVDSFSLPRGPSAAISNLVYRDGDSDAGNDWTAVVTGDEIRWTAPAGDELDWGRLVGFGFDADIAPLPSSAGLGVLDPGSPDTILLDTLAPAAPAVPVGPWIWLLAVLLAVAGSMLLVQQEPKAR